MGAGGAIALRTRWNERERANLQWGRTPFNLCSDPVPSRAFLFFFFPPWKFLNRALAVRIYTRYSGYAPNGYLTVAVSMAPSTGREGRMEFWKGGGGLPVI